MRIGFTPFIAASLLVHAAFFVAPWSGRETVDGAISLGGTALAVRLAPAGDGASRGGDAGAGGEVQRVEPVEHEDAALPQGAADAVAAESRQAAQPTRTASVDGIDSAGEADAVRPAHFSEDRAPVVAEGRIIAGPPPLPVPVVTGATSAVNPDEGPIGDLAGNRERSMPAPPARAPAARSEGGLAGDPAADLPALRADALMTGQIANRLSEAVQTHFHYPALARRHGLEGEVVIGLRVEGDGRLTAIRVVSSSGHRLLDSAALESLSRAERLADARGVPVGGLELTLPVRYRLVDA